MGVTKSQIFSARQNELAQTLRVLGHPARIAILEFISNQKSCICKEIVEEVGLAQPTISQHLKELKSIGLIKGEIEGKKVCYCLDPDKWKSIQESLNKFFDQTSINCC